MFISRQMVDGVLSCAQTFSTASAFCAALIAGVGRDLCLGCGGDNGGVDSLSSLFIVFLLVNGKFLFLS
jgi:hypothetical protein